MRGVSVSRLSPTQAHLWRLLADDEHFDLSGRLCLGIEGDLDEAALERAVRMVFDRHEILRTRFARTSVGSLPEVSVIEPGATTLSRHSLALLADSARQAEVERQLTGTPISLAASAADAATGQGAEPLLLELSDTENLLCLQLPALCADRRSLNNLAHEIVLAYGREIGTDCAALKEPLQYADIAEWMNECLDEDAARSAREFWRGRWKSGRPPTRVSPLPPPLGEQTAAATADAGGRRSVPKVPRHLDATPAPPAIAALDELASRLDVSAEAAVLAGWSVLVSRMIRSPELVIGVVSPGRAYEELDDAVGLLARTLPLVVSIDDNQPFGALVRRVDERLRELAESESFFPWSELAAQRSGRGSERSDRPAEPFFPVAFEASESPALPELPGIRFDIRSRRARVDRCELAARCEPLGGRLTVRIDYDPRRFRRPEAERLAERLQTVLSVAATDAEKPVGELPVVGEAEQRRLLADFNDTAGSYDTDRTLGELIARRISERPGAAAVACGERALTYGELGSSARRIARYLRQQGVGPGVCVGVCVERSVELVAGIVGTLLAGGAYVPLDPAYPAERLAYMLKDSGAPVLLTQRHLLSKLDREAVRVVALDGDDGELAAESDAPLDDGGVRSDDLAYVIYTSGSSGRPKGVMVDHHHVVHSTLARVHYYAEPIERFLLLASCSFDSSVAGIFWSLTEGARLVLPEEGQQQDPQAIADLVAAHRITHMLSLPALYEMVLGRGEAGTPLDSLRTLVLHGEVFSGELTHRHYQHLPACRLYNEYGPTEDSVWSTVYEIPPSITSGQISIGGPIPNTTVYIADEALRLLPLGVPGELLLGGAGVARGYLGRPDLTAERFVPDPFSTVPNARLYRTGDLARFRDDGNLDFLGRVDDQVKIRGYRIEPVEVEIALAEHDGVRQAVVLARPRPSGALQLVAYVVREEGSTLREPELRRFLAARLPEFMVPGAFVFLDALPLMPNGKIDKHSLPEPSEVRPDLEQPYVEPSGDIERFLAERWSDILGIREIGARDNFFELGGDSIQAAIIMNRVRERYGDGVSVAMLFRKPTIAELADELEAAPAQESEGAPAGTAN